MTRPSATARRRMPKPQQHTLSIRISQVMRERLERARQLAASTGEQVSMSTVAKQLLESAREDRLDIVKLLASPTETLLEIRRKGDVRQLVSRAEWAVLAHFIQRGVEAFSSHTPNLVSRNGLLLVLDAFLAVYDLRTAPRSERDAAYLGTLPLECRPATAKRSSRSEQATSDIVRQTVIETRRHVNDHAGLTPRYMPLLVGRNLSMLLEDELLPGSDALNRALRPYWNDLCPLAARGHYAVMRAPIREPSHRPAASVSPMQPITDGNYTLSFVHEHGQELSMLLSFPGALGPRYPIRGYPAISEFRAMLVALADRSLRSWDGAHFVGSAVTSDDNGTAVWFRAHDNGITFRFSEQDWRSVSAFIHRAWELADVRSAWEVLVREYGEL